MISFPSFSYIVKGIPILMYHYLGDTTDKEDIPYYVSRDNFYRQMKYLRQGGYKIISLHELLNNLKNGTPIPKRSIIITFDDGHKSFEDIGVPILEEFGYKATMFIIIRRVGALNYLGKTSIRELSMRDYQFESHSLNHPIITRVPLEEARTEIFDSKKKLEYICGKKVSFYAYRGGHYNDKIIDLVQQAGYSAAVCSNSGLNTKDANLYSLKRMAIRGSDNIDIFSKKLLGNSIWRPSVAHLIHYSRI